MGYAMLGIPISMVMFQSMGERMNKAFIIIIKTFRKWRGLRRIEVSEFDLILASGITSSIVVSFGAVLFHTQEGWSFFDSLYYCFITLSTIGFGDYVALQSGSVLQVIYQVLVNILLQNTAADCGCSMCISISVNAANFAAFSNLDQQTSSKSRFLLVSASGLDWKTNYESCSVVKHDIAAANQLMFAH